MIADLKPYAEYKESGLPWLGRIPSHWKLLRSRYLFREVDERSIKGEETRLSMSQQHGLIRSSRINEHRLVSETQVGAKICEAGYLVLNRLKAHLGVFALASERGLVSPDYTVLRPIRNLEARYFEAFYRTPVCRGELYRRAKGIVEGFWRLYTDDYYDVHAPVPNTNEQVAILKFLDHANGRLVRAIRAKRKVITLLNEQKQAIIHRAVTRGLDASVALKPSGISWLGDIQQHWEVISLRMRYAVDLGKMLDAKRITGRHSVPYLRNRDVQWDRIVTDDLPVMDIPPREIARYTVKRGDLLVCEGGKVGRSAFWDEQLPVCGFQKALHRVRCHDGSCDYSRFFFYQMQLAAGRGVFSADGNENTIAHLTCEKLRRHRFAFPPFAEQKAVADSLDGEFRQFQIAISRLEREIELLREYRIRLVADVVTGKLDVRDAAARLPEEDAPDPVEDIDVSDETEPADEEAAA